MYGATALAGGKGGIQCAQHIFEKDDIIEFYLEGRNAGGIGGKKCGLMTDGNAYDGAGLAKAIRKNHSDFEVVAGGGGGNSENNKTKGGDFETNGEGKYGGQGATNTTYGKSGNRKHTEGIDGEKYKGGNGSRNAGLFQQCGGGGGNGYYGGGGGGYGIDGEAGGGGGGSNYCLAKICSTKDINNEGVYSGYIIYFETINDISNK